MNKLVSILIPTYNREDHIVECVNSARAQTYPNIEIIIVDNNSSDNTWDICQRLAKEDGRIKTFRNSENIGPVRNWQRCINEATGDIGKILFSDDTIEADYLEKALPLLNKPGVGLVFSHALIGANKEQANSAYRWKKKSGIYQSKDFIRSAFFSAKIPVSPGAALFHLKDLKENISVDIASEKYTDFLDHGAGPDQLLYLLTAYQHPLVGYIDEPLSFFRSHSGSITIQYGNLGIIDRYLHARAWFLKQSKYRKWLLPMLYYSWKKIAEYRSCMSLSEYYESFGIKKPTSKVILEIYLKLLKLKEKVGP